MKMTRAILSVALAIALMAGVSAQDKPNFAGKWKADGSFTQYTITVEGSKMIVTVTIAGNSDSTVYMLDGTPHSVTGEGPNGPITTTFTSTWEGDVLVTTIAGANSTRIERRSIEADGTMKVQSTFTIMQGKPAPPPPPGAGVLVLKRVGEAK